MQNKEPGLQTLECDFEMRDFDSNELSLFLEQESIIPICEDLFLENMRQTSINNAMDEILLTTFEDTNGDSSAASDEEPTENNERPKESLNWREVLTTMTQVQEHIESFKRLSVVPKCLSNDNCSAFEGTVSSLIYELEMTLRKNSRQSKISEFWQADS